jgi:hypothetical protein
MASSSTPVDEEKRYEQTGSMKNPPIAHLINDVRLALRDLILAFEALATAVSLPPAVSATLKLRNSEGDQVMQLADNQPGSYAVQLDDVDNNPAVLAAGAVPVWSITDPTIATLTPSADGLSCAVAPLGKLGSAQVQWSCPAVGAEPALSASDALTIVASVATQAVLVGTPG